MLLNNPLRKMNVDILHTIHSFLCPLSSYSSHKPLYWFSCFHSCQFQCILYPQQKAELCQSVIPAIDFPKVHLNGLRGSARSCLLLITSTPSARYLKSSGASDKSSLRSILRLGDCLFFRVSD